MVTVTEAMIVTVKVTEMETLAGKKTVKIVTVTEKETVTGKASVTSRE